MTRISTNRKFLVVKKEVEFSYWDLNLRPSPIWILRPSPLRRLLVKRDSVLLLVLIGFLQGSYSGPLNDPKRIPYPSFPLTPISVSVNTIVTSVRSLGGSGVHLRRLCRLNTDDESQLSDRHVSSGPWQTQSLPSPQSTMYTFIMNYVKFQNVFC